MRAAQGTALLATTATYVEGILTSNVATLTNYLKEPSNCLKLVNGSITTVIGLHKPVVVSPRTNETINLMRSN